jgi:NAD+ kinase
MTPVAPHSAFSRSIIFNADSKISVIPSSDREVFLTVDGEEGIPINFDDKVDIYKSEKKLKLINFSGKGFYQVLCDKLLNK